MRLKGIIRIFLPSESHTKRNAPKSLNQSPIAFTIIRAETSIPQLFFEKPSSLIQVGHICHPAIIVRCADSIKQICQITTPSLCAHKSYTPDSIHPTDGAARSTINLNSLGICIFGPLTQDEQDEITVNAALSPCMQLGCFFLYYLNNYLFL